MVLNFHGSSQSAKATRIMRLKNLVLYGHVRTHKMAADSRILEESAHLQWCRPESLQDGSRAGKSVYVLCVECGNLTHLPVHIPFFNTFFPPKTTVLLLLPKQVPVKRHWQA